MDLHVLFFIILATVVVSLKTMNDANLTQRLTFSPYSIKHNNEGYRILTHIWIHKDFMHLAFNMMSLYFLGNLLLKEFRLQYGDFQGQVHFAILYLIGGTFSTIIPYLRNSNNPSYHSLGASGAVSAVIFATIIWLPEIQLGIMFLPFFVPGYIFGLLYIAIEIWSDRRGGTGIAHDAHIGGAITGIIYILVFNMEKGVDFIQKILPF
jgi:membrane associated rhomboid family serine protease